ncbi:Surface antigen [Limimonas halophila]|uniref:17 kDa surface antigen n=1 Tax=Limimonas halophila TaxID=1082479 RepID=A0A1G7L9E0_9PROT|nr:RT0821/Lpp0805 family surface protein [Limimonas halophila]SDF46118.1 Surface antigen [Limimonas halophila]
MARTVRAAVFTMIAVLALASCAREGGRGPSGGEVVGSVAGAVVGGVVGSEIGNGSSVAVGAGSAIGALIGREIGSELSRRSQQRMARTTQDTLQNNETGQTSSWDNPDAEERGSVTPTETYQRDDGQYCREFQQTVVIGGETKQAYGTACRQPDGSWKIVNRG